MGRDRGHRGEVVEGVEAARAVGEHVVLGHRSAHLIDGFDGEGKEENKKKCCVSVFFFFLTRTYLVKRLLNFSFFPPTEGRQGQTLGHRARWENARHAARERGGGEVHERR